MVKYVVGDLFGTKANVIAHGVNCRGAFGSGIAGQIRKRYPEVYDAYIDKYRSKKGWKLGDVQYVVVTDHIIANCATQDNYGTDKINVDYLAVKDCLMKLGQHCSDTNLSLALPRIGAGLAGGNWTTIKNIIENVFNKLYPKVDVTVYSLENDK
jgi:O-acetyl-ADP-ribose deacetylase (regulator of RNase III)